MAANPTVPRLKFFLRTNPSKSEVRSIDPETEVSFVPMEAVGEYGGLDLQRARPLSDVMDGYTYFRDGDVVVAKITPCFENGKGALAADLSAGIGFGTTELHVLRALDGLDSRYLFYLTISHRFRKLGESTMYGAGGQKRVSDDFIMGYRHELPPLPAQRAIADFLDRQTAKIDALIEKKRRLINLLDEKRTALITRAVTCGLDPDAPMKDSGVEWLGKIPAHWEVARFRHVCRIRGGQVDPASEAYRDFPLVAPNHIQSDEGEIKGASTASEQGAVSGKYLVRGGDLVYSKIRPELNKVAIASQDCLCSADMYAIRADDSLLQRFLLYWMLSKPFVQLMVDESMRVAMPKVNRDSLGGAPVPLPPVDEQGIIVEHLRAEHQALVGLLDRSHRAMSLLWEYRSALVAAAVTGRIEEPEIADSQIVQLA